MATQFNILRTPADISAWVKAIVNLHGPAIEHLTYPEDCQKIVQQFKAAGAHISAVEAQGFWYAYCHTMSSGWMTPFAGYVKGPGSSCGPLIGNRVMSDFQILILAFWGVATSVAVLCAGMVIRLKT